MINHHVHQFVKIAPINSNFKIKKMQHLSSFRVGSPNSSTHATMNNVVNIADDRHAFLLIKKFPCQYWNYTVAPSGGTLYITPRFVLFEYGGKGGADNSSSVSSGVPGINSSMMMGSSGGGYIEEEDVYTQLPNEQKELKSHANCIIIPFQDIQLASKTTYLFKSVLLIQTNLTSYYFIGLKSITNACSVINHVLDQLRMYGSKPRSVSKKRKERAIELKVDENGFLKEIQYGEDSEDETESDGRLIYSARGKKLDPFSYIKSLTPSNFTSKKSIAEVEAQQQSQTSSQAIIPTTNNASNATSSSFNYYLSGLYSYSVGPLVNMFTTTEKKDSTPNYMDHSSLEVLIKDDRWYKKYMILDETGFSIIDPSNKNKTELFVPYNQITDVHTVNTFICNLRLVYFQI